MRRISSLFSRLWLRAKGVAAVRPARSADAACEASTPSQTAGSRLTAQEIQALRLWWKESFDERQTRSVAELLAATKEQPAAAPAQTHAPAQSPATPAARAA